MNKGLQEFMFCVGVLSQQDIGGLNDSKAFLAVQRLTVCDAGGQRISKAGKGKDIRKF